MKVTILAHIFYFSLNFCMHQIRAFLSGFCSIRTSPVVNIFEKDVMELAQFIKSKSHLVAITGAGVSTNSGIPDYRGNSQNILISRSRGFICLIMSLMKRCFQVKTAVTAKAINPWFTMILYHTKNLVRGIGHGRY